MYLATSAVHHQCRLKRSHGRQKQETTLRQETTSKCRTRPYNKMLSSVPQNSLAVALHILQGYIQEP